MAPRKETNQQRLRRRAPTRPARAHREVGEGTQGALRGASANVDLVRGLQRLAPNARDAAAEPQTPDRSVPLHDTLGTGTIDSSVPVLRRGGTEGLHVPFRGRSQSDSFGEKQQQHRFYNFRGTKENNNWQK